MKSSNFKKFIAFSMSAFLVACGQASTSTSSQASSTAESVQVGILQFAEHPALSSAREGFIEAMTQAGFEEGKNVTYNLQNAAGEQSNLQSMSEQLVKDADILFAIATPAAQALANVEAEKPIVFTAVTDPVAAGLVGDLNKPDANVTGTIDLTPVDQQIEKLLAVVPDAQSVGIFYNSSEVNSESQAKAAVKALEAKGVKAVEMTVTSTNEVQQVMESLASQVDAIYFPTDTTVASTIATIGEILKVKKVPALGGDEAVLEGMLVTFGVDYHAIGVQAGKQAAAILSGKAVADLPVEEPTNPSIAINEEMAQALGLDLAQIKSQLGVE